MKTMKTFIVSGIVALTISIASAQECSNFYPLEEGASWEITSYNKKGKVEGVSNFTVSEVVSEDGKEVATLDTSFKDKKGEELITTNYDITCAGEVVSIDFKSLMSGMMAQQYKDMEMTFTGTDISLPNNLSVGQSLDDANMTMRIDMGGMGMNMNVDMTDRKVIAQETVTTPAGTYDCYVITYTTKVKMGMGRTFSGKQWIAEGVGMVKQEDYNKKGKVTSRSELTAFSR